MDPPEAHVAHLRHLARKSIASRVLRERYELTGESLDIAAELVAAHISHALRFYSASKTTGVEIRSVLQYYCYLHLAVAVVAAYRPPNWQNYRRHGLSDMTASTDRLSLSSKVVKATSGAVTLFNDVIGISRIDGRVFTLRDICSNINMVSVELRAYFDIAVAQHRVYWSIVESIPNLRILFHIHQGEGDFPKARWWLSKMPELRAAFEVRNASASEVTFLSKRMFKTQEEAAKYIELNCVSLFNIGGHVFNAEGVLMPTWYVDRRRSLVSSLVSMLMLSFVNASIVRYRPVLINNMAASPYAVLLDVVSAETDAVVIPAMRNLLYREQLTIAKVRFC